MAEQRNESLAASKLAGGANPRDRERHAPGEAMVEFYVEPWDEPDGRTTWCVRQIVYRPSHYTRQVVSWHETRQEAQEERDRLAA